MRIVNRQSFLAMPAGTLFSKFQPCVFGELCIKGDTVGQNDFYVQAIADAIRHNDSNEYADALLRSKDTGEAIEMDFEFEGRDGLFDGPDVMFAVWERKDVEALIARLQTAIVGMAPESTYPQPVEKQS